MRPTNQSRLSYSMQIDPSSSPSTILKEYSDDQCQYTIFRLVLTVSIDGGDGRSRTAVFTSFS